MLTLFLTASCRDFQQNSTKATTMARICKKVSYAVEERGEDSLVTKPPIKM